jgi:type I restriction enzyme S subunit
VSHRDLRAAKSGISSASQIPLGDVTIEITDRNASRIYTEVRSVTNSQGLVRTSDFFDNSRTSADTKNYKVVQQGMFVYNPSRINVGSIGWLTESAPVIVSPMYVVFKLDTTRILPEYLQLLFDSSSGRRQIENKTEVGARFRLPYQALARIQFPLPSLEVQQDIVKDLNLFTDLEATLKEELEARKRQYAFYRDSLITTCKTGIDLIALGEIASVRVGQAPTTEVLAEEGPYAFVNAGTTESGRSLVANTPGDTVTIPSRGQGGVGIVGYQLNEFWCGPLCYRVTSLSANLRTRFLYHYLKAIQPSIRGLQQAGGTPALNRKELVLVNVAVPAIEEQERMISVLDKFDALVNDTRSGLPAEIAARRRQYEYYRDRLLTFEEKMA